jgi:hypothetical protein
MFNPEQFLELQVTDANSTKSTPCPVGEYIAIVESVKARQWTKKDDPSIGGMAVDIVWSIDDAGVKQALERDKVNVKQGIMLDLTETGGIDTGKGKNVGLGRLREACGLNEPGRPFAFSMLTGRMAKVRIKHRVDGDNIYGEVDAVARV